MPGKRRQYVSRNFSGSRQKPRVIPGNGLRQTSSPTSPEPTSDRPSASTTSIAIPSAGPPSEQVLIGVTGVGDRKQAPTSVPPEQLMIGTREPPTVSNSHRYGSGFHGSPIRQSRSGGQSGAPSAKTMVAPSAPAPTSVHAPMIQPMSVAKCITSPS